MMKPIEFEAVNDYYGKLPVNQTHGMILSRWGMTWRERLSILLCGKIWVMFYGGKMPPILISGEQAFEALPLLDDEWEGASE